MRFMMIYLVENVYCALILLKVFQLEISNLNNYFRCEMKDILENETHKTKFNLKRFKNEINSLCRKDINICNGEFIGPIKSHKDDLFYISFDKKRNYYN